MWKHFRTTLAVFLLLSFLEAGPSVYLYVIKFENITQEKSIDWLGQGFVDMINAKMASEEKVKLRNQDDLEKIMNKRSLLLHQPRGSRNFLLLGKFERKLDKIDVSLQLIDIATWEEADRRKLSGNYNEVAALNLKLTSTVEMMLATYIPVSKKKANIYPEFSVGKISAKRSSVLTESRRVSKSIHTAIDELEKSMDFVIGARGEESKDGAVKIGEEWVLDLGSSSQPSYNPEYDTNTQMLMVVLDDLMKSPYNVKMNKPKFEYDVDNTNVMNVLFEVEYSLKDHIIKDMLKSLPYTGLKQDGSLMIFTFNKDKFNFSNALKEKIRFGQYRSIPVLTFLNESNDPTVLIVDSPEMAIHQLKSNRIHYVVDHRFSPLIDFTIGGWSLQVAMESVEIPITYRFSLPIDTADSIRRISLKFIPEAELSSYLQSLL
ncbi:MAG: hypothetical protein IIB95_10845 [Candidatus Marinimicrobia bacterium]|nr:hypothetical protein [Candidatus Neomarinimicrobiota bacterium]